MSIKYPDFRNYPDRRIVLLDSAGLETPVLISNDENRETLVQGKNNKIQIMTKKLVMIYLRKNQKKK